MNKLDGKRNLRQQLDASKKEILKQSHQIKEQNRIIEKNVELKFLLERKLGIK